MADGGEGTLAAVARGPGRARRAAHASTTRRRPGPAGQADWLLLDEGRGAFVEMAAASGLARLTAEERTPATPGVASRRGTGELLRAALDAGVQRDHLGLGGSRHHRRRQRMLAALGVRLLDRPARSCRPAARRWPSWP